MDHPLGNLVVSMAPNRAVVLSALHHVSKAWLAYCSRYPLIQALGYCVHPKWCNLCCRLLSMLLIFYMGFSPGLVVGMGGWDSLGQQWPGHLAMSSSKAQ